MTGFYTRENDKETQADIGAVADILKGERRNIEFGGYKWRVLDKQDNMALLLTEDIIETRPYNMEDAGVTWESCTLRQYLNSEFIGRFSAQERMIILETTNINPNNPWYDTRGGNNTNDKAFLLSIDEVVKYFGDSGQMKNERLEKDGYISDEYSNERVGKYDDIGAWWWLRSPGHSSDLAAYVHDDGELIIYGSIVYYADVGVRPVFWLNLEIENIKHELESEDKTI
ncbi:MAG: DUF6273 domain-containing protein [Clostridiales Family XIII bacterium]|jgi:hypothetical protein|nr:DUF6273 domain-containing protein [Clostridiales Family XIII bacterium]